MTSRKWQHTLLKQGLQITHEKFYAVNLNKFERLDGDDHEDWISPDVFAIISDKSIQTIQLYEE